MNTFYTINFIIGLLSAGMYFAYFQKEYPDMAKDQYWPDLLSTYFIGLTLGILNIVIWIVVPKFLIGLHKNGLKFW